MIGDKYVISEDGVEIARGKVIQVDDDLLNMTEAELQKELFGDELCDFRGGCPELQLEIMKRRLLG
jgi:hypothetical protein